MQTRPTVDQTCVVVRNSVNATPFDGDMLVGEDLAMSLQNVPLGKDGPLPRGAGVPDCPTQAVLNSVGQPSAKHLQLFSCHQTHPHKSENL